LNIRHRRDGHTARSQKLAELSDRECRAMFDIAL
jgi:hypothetical protein